MNDIVLSEVSKDELHKALLWSQYALEECRWSFREYPHMVENIDRVIAIRAAYSRWWHARAIEKAIIRHKRKGR